MFNFYLLKLHFSRWVESVIQEPLPDAQQWEYSLCNGICLCKLGSKLLPDFPIWKKIYDIDQTRFKVNKYIQNSDCYIL